MCELTGKRVMIILLLVTLQLDADSCVHAFVCVDSRTPSPPSTDIKKKIIMDYSHHKTAPDNELSQV